MSEASERSIEQEQELRRRFGSGDDDKLISEGKSVNTNSQYDNLNLSPTDSENEQRIGSDSDHVRKNFIDFLNLPFPLLVFCVMEMKQYLAN